MTDTYEKMRDYLLEELIKSKVPGYTSDFMKEVLRKKEIVESDSYLDWIKDICEYDILDSSPYCEYKSEDKENVELLDAFYTYVDTLASIQNVSCICDCFDSIYYISIDDGIYKFYLSGGQGTTCTIQKLNPQLKSLLNIVKIR